MSLELISTRSWGREFRRSLSSACRNQQRFESASALRDCCARGLRLAFGRPDRLRLLLVRTSGLCCGLVTSVGAMLTERPYSCRMTSMSARNTGPLAAALLAEGLADWIHLSDIDWFVRREFPEVPEAGIPRLAAEVIRELISEGLVEVGDVTQAGFTAWVGPVDASVGRIEAEWLALGRPPIPGDVCWLANTEIGDERTRTIG